ncbi:hypothetical protein [Ketogulonicigenium vulgare]|uniref:hypothetical protein n=1 Tax=Ketogulonicigenium vulgare TaxID=92945 RepID=UPI00235A4144|nr:hypothetical protein [Ketogulonicigenium vulgare]
MNAIANLRPVDAEKIFEYPIPAGVRLDGHGWFKFQHSWWRNSEFHRKADRDVRAVFLDLLCAAQDEDPVGTLPVEDDAIAWLARVPMEEWRGMMERRLTPLYGWQRCVCTDGRMRLYHPKLLIVTQDATASKAKAKEKAAVDAERKRLDAIAKWIPQAGGTARMADDAALILSIDEWLTQNIEVGKNRGARAVKDALEAISMPRPNFG